MEDVLAKFGIKTAHFIAGLIGSGIGLLFSSRPRTKREMIKVFLIVFGGALVTGYCTPLLIKWQQWLVGVEYSAGFMIGLFGMGILEGTFRALKAFAKDPFAVIQRIKEIVRK